jgi:hypothetical protein
MCQSIQAPWGQQSDGRRTPPPESFRARPGGARAAHTTPFRGEKNSNWEAAFRVPCFIKWPGHFPEGTTLNGIVSREDWMIDRAFVLVPLQAVASKFLLTLKEFPPSQKPGDWSHDSLERQIKNMTTAGE